MTYMVGAELIGGATFGDAASNGTQLDGVIAGSTTVTATLGIIYQVTATIVTGTTVTQSGAVVVAPLGTASIVGSTVVTADVDVERRRTMVVFVNAGLTVTRALTVSGAVADGTGKRRTDTADIGHPVLPREPMFV